MKRDTEAARERLLSLIDARFESDAAFERECGIADKTVNNWRRGRSASFMKMLPALAEALSVTVADLLDIPLGEGEAELSSEERQILSLYRRARVLPKGQRDALDKTLVALITMYIESAPEKARSKRKAAK